MFPDGVDFLNVGSTIEKELGYFLFLFEIDMVGRKREKGGATSR
jgi:hypothetical protein